MNCSEVLTIALADYTACPGGAPAACGASAAAPSIFEVGFCMGFYGQRCRTTNPLSSCLTREFAHCQVSGLGRSTGSGSAQMCPVCHWPECFSSLAVKNLDTCGAVSFPA